MRLVKKIGTYSENNFQATLKVRQLNLSVPCKQNLAIWLRVPVMTVTYFEIAKLRSMGIGIPN